MSPTTSQKTTELTDRTTVYAEWTSSGDSQVTEEAHTFDHSPSVIETTAGAQMSTTAGAPEETASSTSQPSFSTKGSSSESSSTITRIICSNAHLQTPNHDPEVPMP